MLTVAKENPIEAPKSQIVVSNVYITDLVIVENEDKSYSVNMQVNLNTDYTPTNGTGITITATSGELSSSVEATGGSSYPISIDNYVPGTPIDIVMSGTQYLPVGVYFYEPYAEEGENVREVSQNMVGINAGEIPVGDSLTLMPVSMSVNKTNEAQQSLSGAEFTLYYINTSGNSVEIGKYTTDNNGSVVIDSLMEGVTYKLVETQAPNGYFQLEDEMIFTVSGDGSSDFEIIQLPDGVEFPAENGNAAITVKNKEIVTSTIINGKKFLDGKSSAGFTFGIYRINTDGSQKLLATTVSDENGDFRFHLDYTDGGTYKYVVVELAGDDKKIIYDDTVFEVTVRVDIDSESFNATVETEEIVFNNKTDPGPSPSPNTGDNNMVFITVTITLSSILLTVFSITNKKRILNSHRSNK